MSLPTKTADPMPTKQPIHECRPATIKQEQKKQRRKPIHHTVND